MQKKYADFKLGVPDYVTVETEEERLLWNSRTQVNMKIYLSHPRMQ